MNDSPQTLFYS